MKTEKDTKETDSAGQSNSSGEQPKKKKRWLKVLMPIIGVLTPFILAIILILLLFGSALNVFFEIKEGFEKLFGGDKQIEEEVDFEVWVNDPENVLNALKDGDITYDGSGLNLSDDDIIRILEHVLEYNNGRKQEKIINYEKGIFIANDSMIRSEATVTMNRSDTESEVLENGTDMFQLRWQLILALCSMSSVNHNDEWGETVQLDPTIPLEDNETNDYFISDDTIDEIIDIVDFKFQYYYNFFDSEQTTYTWEDLDKAAYTVEGENIEYIPAVGDIPAQNAVLINRRPANAPRQIYNSFITYTYNYEAYENEYADYFTSSGLQLTNRTLTINPTTFVNECKRLIPSFDFAWLLTNLKILPGASDIYEQYYDYYELYQNRESLTQTQECSIGQVVLGVNMQGVGGENPEDPPKPGDPVDPPEGPGIIVEDGGFKIWVPSYSDTKRYNGWYFLSNDTLLPLNASDNLTLEQIQSLLDYISTHYKYKEECGLTSCAQALYDAQYTYGTSVCGVLAIVIQEGAIGTDKGTHWNYMNWAAAKGQPTVDGRFRDFTMFGSPNAAMGAQLELMYNNWFGKGQTCYYEFIWHNYDFENLSSITHSFCPCWDDSSFPWNRVDDPGIYVGWPNKCADYRNLLMNLL